MPDQFVLYHFKFLDPEQLEFLETRIGKSFEGLIYDLLRDAGTGEWDMLIEREKVAEVNDLLDQVGISQW